MKTFLVELEKAMATMPPAKAQDVGQAYLALIRGVRSVTQVVGPHFRPSKRAVLGMFADLTGAMGPGGAERLIAKVRKEAASVGPRVTALVQAI